MPRNMLVTLLAQRHARMNFVPRLMNILQEPLNWLVKRALNAMRTNQ